ncbi:MAG: DUF11 domain-containing protein [Clostridia bacterium]|nr:DUF11 domain-containing protein [Clostridia bacterium]
MATIENFATVSYTSGGITETKVSNLAEIGLESAISFTKTTLGETYGEDEVVTYILSMTNTSTSAITNVSITDDLGTFVFGTLELTPLTYAPPALLLIDGQDVSAQLTVDTATAGSLVFSFPTLPAGATANIVYRAAVNEYAPLDVEAGITNTATLTSDSDCADGTASATITAVSAANVSVFKQMSPNPVICGDTVTYTIRIYNYGNIAAENVVLTDTFNPAPTNITVSRDGTLLPANEYSYVDGTLTVPAGTTTAVSVPAATFVRDATTGIVTVTPGMIEYTITGTI